MQVDDELGVKLHDRATRGMPLSEEERVQLQAWYDEKDREEAEMLRASRKRDEAKLQRMDKLSETIGDELGSKLHDRSTRGQQLSSDEQAQLQAWYDKWDRLEMAQFGFSPEQLAAEDARLAALRAKVKADEEVLAEMVRLNQLLTRQNEELRTEIASLQLKLTKSASAKTEQSSQLSQLAR